MLCAGSAVLGVDPRQTHGDAGGHVSRGFHGSTTSGLKIRPIDTTQLNAGAVAVMREVGVHEYGEAECTHSDQGQRECGNPEDVRTV